jgi:hypothetical protein
MNYPTCRTCKHYTLLSAWQIPSGLPDDPYGRCDVIFGSSRKAGAWTGYEDLKTHPDKFGCNLHEPLIEEKEG